MSSIALDRVKEPAVLSERVPVLGSIIIPAHDEEFSIGRCLASLLRTAKAGEFEVIVACNGCTDATAAVARAFADYVTVIELPEGNKVAALNAANRAAHFFPRLYLDADLEITTDTARSFLSSLRESEHFATIGRMDLDVSGAPWILRQYYGIWLRNRYFDLGKFGGVYALSEAGFRHVGVLPRLTNDDEYVRRKIPAGKTMYLPDCRFVARVPATLGDLLAVRRRVHRGNRELAAVGTGRTTAGRLLAGLSTARSLVLRTWHQPALWPGLAAYLCINLAARHGARRQDARWERDQSSRRRGKAVLP